MKENALRQQQPFKSRLSHSIRYLGGKSNGDKTAERFLFRKDSAAFFTFANGYFPRIRAGLSRINIWISDAVMPYPTIVET